MKCLFTIFPKKTHVDTVFGQRMEVFLFELKKWYQVHICVLVYVLILWMSFRA